MKFTPWSLFIIGSLLLVVILIVPKGTDASGTVDINVNDSVQLLWNSGNVSNCSVTSVGYSDPQLATKNQYDGTRSYSPNFFTPGVGKSGKIFCDSPIYGTVDDRAFLIVHPLPPASASASCDAPGTAANLSWAAASGANSYRVEVSTSASCPVGWDQGSGGCGKTVTGTSVSFQTQAGLSYAWQVYSKAGAVNSLSPLSGSVFSCTPPVNNPIGSLDSASCTEIAGWTCDLDAPSQALDVHLYRDGQYGSGGTFIGNGTANITREAAVGAMCGGNTAHGYRIVTPSSIKDGTSHSIYAYGINVGSGGNLMLGGSPRSVNCPAPVVPPTTPTRLSATPRACGTGQIDITWDPVLGATSYTLRDSGNLIYSGPGTSYTHSGLSNGSAHSYTITASNSGGESPVSATAAVSAPIACPPVGTAPTTPPSFAAFTDSLCGGGTKLIWTTVPGATSYEVSNNGSTWTDVGNTITYTYTLSPSTWGTYYVRAKNSSGVSAAAGPQSAQSSAACPPVGTPPGTPGGFAAFTDSLCGGGTKLIWTTVPGATSYEVSNNGSTWTDVGNTITYTYNPGPSTWGTYYVRAKNSSGVSAAAGPQSAQSSAACPPVGTPPGTPSNFLAGTGSCGGQINMSWGGSTGVVDSYEVTSDGSTWIPISSASSAHVFTGLNSGQTYSVNVRARNSAGVSAGAGPRSVVASGVCATPPPTPQNVSAQTGACGGRIDVTWSPVAGATSYEVSGNGGFSWNPTTMTSYTFTNLAYNNPYSGFRVRSVNSVGTSAASPSASAQSSDICPIVPPPPPPVGTSISFSNNGPISSGSYAVLSYTVTGWDTCQITRQPQNSNLGGSFGGNIGSGGRDSDYNMSVSQTYRLRCSITATGQSDFRDTTVVVNPAGATNLTSPSPLGLASGSLLPNQSVTFRGEIRNNGTADIFAPFHDNFTYCWGAGCVPSTQIGAHILQAPIARGVSRNDLSAALVLPGSSNGVLRVQHCVDSNPAAGVIPETNESDNCRTQDFWVGYSCYGTTPTYASFCPNDDLGLTRDMPRTLVNTCSTVNTTDGDRCEYSCMAGYRPNALNTACEQIPVCVGNAYAETAYYPGDDVNLPISTTKQYSAVNNPGVMCEFYCTDPLKYFDGAQCRRDCPVGQQWNGVSCEDIDSGGASCGVGGTCNTGTFGSLATVFQRGVPVGTSWTCSWGPRWNPTVESCFMAYAPTISLQAANIRPTTPQTTLSWTSTLDPQNCKLYVEDPTGSGQTLVANVPNTQSGYPTISITQPVTYSISCDGGVSDTVEIKPGVRSYAATIPGGATPAIAITDTFQVTLDAYYADSCYFATDYPNFVMSGYQQIQSSGWTKTSDLINPNIDHYVSSNHRPQRGSEGRTYTWRFQCNGDYGGSNSSIPPSVSMSILGNATQCSNGIDDTDPEDTLVDMADPGCHSDGNPANGASYVATDDDETDGAAGLPDLVITDFNITTGGPYPVNGAINFTGRVNNAGADGPSTIFSNNFTYQLNGAGGWQPIASLPHGGGQPLLSGAVFNDAASYTPTQNGILRIQYCVDANPISGVINEGPAGEANNCVTSGPLTIGTGIPPGGPQCSNGGDDDGDLKTDFPQDPGCTDASDDDETNGGPSNPDCTRSVINNCQREQTANGGSSGSCSATGSSGNCSYQCGGGGTWDDAGGTNTCTPSNITRFEVCDADGTSNCVSSGGTKNVDAGAPILVRWNASNATFCNAVSGTGFATGGATNGTDPAVAPATANINESYTIACGNGTQVSDTETVTIHTNAAGPTLTIDPRVVSSRDPAFDASNPTHDRTITVSWDTNNGNEALCTLVKTGSATNLLTPGGNPEEGSVTPVIDARTTFTLTCPGLPPVSRTVEYRTSLIET